MILYFMYTSISVGFERVQNEYLKLTTTIPDIRRTQYQILNPEQHSIFIQTNAVRNQ